MNIKRLSIVLTIVIVGIYAPVSAQRVQTGVNTPGTVPTGVPSQCADGVDNNKDGKADKNGVKDSSGKQVYPPDPNCQAAGAICEDGSKDCGTRYAATSTSTTSGSGFALNIKIKNPLKVDTIQGAIGLFMDAVLRITLPFIVIFFIWSGLSFVLARGNPDKIKTAKNMFLYTVIGTLLILGAWTITNAIIGTVNSITS